MQKQYTASVLQDTYKMIYTDTTHIPLEMPRTLMIQKSAFLENVFKEWMRDLVAQYPSDLDCKVKYPCNFRCVHRKNREVIKGGKRAGTEIGIGPETMDTRTFP